MQNNTLSVGPICSLMETMYKPLSHIKPNDVWEREDPAEESEMQTHSLP